ncbi:MAG: pyruvate dehydrogenase (acetyl-transferring) E1 component subunit alpha [Antricoccus sp.]
MAHSPESLLPTAEPISLIDQDGAAVENSDYSMPDDSTLLAGYGALVVGRRINDQAYALVRQGRLAVYPSSHGQEACQVAAALALGANDWLFPTYRDTVAVITRGVDPIGVMESFRGDWHCGYDPKQYKVATQSTPLATQLLHAVGVAHAATLRGEDTVAVALCGDGATSEGDFHEALNFAAVFKAPVVFLIQNNEYAISVPLAKQSAAPSLAHKGVGYGIPSHRVDGNDIAAMLAVVGEAIAQARAGGGPQLIEAHTYRMQAHTNADDATRYRTADEVAQWQERDPLSRAKTYLTDQGILDERSAAGFTAQADQIAAELRTALGAESSPDPDQLFKYVYEKPTSALIEQQAMLSDEIERESV